MKDKFLFFKAKIKQIDDILFILLKKYMWAIVMCIATCLSIVAQSFAFPFLSGDYNSFLVHWMREYQSLGIHDGFGASLGDYTPAYNYYLCIIGVTCPETGWVYAIKIFDIVFGLSFSAATFLIVQKCFNKLNYSALAYSVSLIIPSIIINSAFWGQCDIVFASFIVWSFYFVLAKKYNLALIFFSISFAFKLQAVFFAPFLFLLLLKREVKIYQIIYIPLIYLLIALPALICGRSFVGIVSVYSKQAGEYRDRINLLAPSIYAYFDDSIAKTFGYIPIIIFFVITVSYIFYLYYKDIELNKENLITIALISVLFSPFFLPHMHERYFFLADLFAVLYVFIKKKGIFICLMINFASIICCGCFVFGGYNFRAIFSPFNPVLIGATINLIAIGLLVIEMIKMPSRKNIDTNSCN